MDEMARQGTTSSYICAAIFFFGALYGAVMVAKRELPLISGVGVLFAAAMAIFCFRTARKVEAKGKTPN